LHATIKQRDLDGVGRAAAFLYVDFIADLLRLRDQFEIAIGPQLFTLSCLKPKNFQSARKALFLYSKLLGMLRTSTDGIRSCLGMKEENEAGIRAKNETRKLRRSKR
jgi:hypothetical protein